MNSNLKRLHHYEKIPSLLSREAKEAMQYAPHLIETIREPLLILNSSFHVKSANRSFYLFFQVLPQDVVGRCIYELGAGQWNIPKLHHLLEDILPSHTYFDDLEVECCFPKIGRKIILLNARQVVGIEGHESMILMAFEDITEHHLLRERDHAIQARDELISIVSHELKNPLTAMISTIELFKSSLPNDSGFDKIRRLLATLHSTSMRMAKITSDLLDAGQIESGHLLLKPRKTEVNQIVVDAISLNSATALGKSIELKHSVTPPDLKGSFDRDRIFQVLLNLIGNAIKFTHPGGQVEVNARLIDGRVRIEVADTGEGISEEEIPHLFERFWQSKRMQSPGGKGLGLYIARGIIEAHGGRIWAESRPGKGATFFFELPI